MQRLCAINTGQSSGENASRLFQRFIKSNPKSQSLGLGLSIVKAICDTYAFVVHYEIAQGLHKVTVKFSAGS
jgi:hypothetical protein